MKSSSSSKSLEEIEAEIVYSMEQKFWEDMSEDERQMANFAISRDGTVMKDRWGHRGPQTFASRDPFTGKWTPFTFAEADPARVMGLLSDK